MTVSHYTILYRPHGSEVWTPAEIKGRDAGNFFASKEKAIQCAEHLASSWLSFVRFGARDIVPIAYTVASVLVEDDEPIYITKVNLTRN